MNRDTASALIGGILLCMFATHGLVFGWGIWVGHKDAHLEDMSRDHDAIATCGVDQAYVHVGDGLIACGEPPRHARSSQ